jgi:hypothetical protein
MAVMSAVLVAGMQGEVYFRKAVVVVKVLVVLVVLVVVVECM